MRLGKVAGEVVAAKLDELEVNKVVAHEGVSPYRVVYVQSHVRTRQWFKGGETLVWDDGGENCDAHYAAPKTKRKTSLIQTRGENG